MRAAFYEKSGPAKEVLGIREFDKPSPGPGEVLVKIHASGINPTDTKSRTVIFDRVKHLVPIIPHQDGAGVIEAVGAGVDASRTGERVWLYTAQWLRSFGTCAEYIALPEELALHLPDGTSFEEGACLGVPAMTAYHAVTLNGPIKDKSVLVTGGAGAVGHYAIQFARLLGASKIISTISGDEKAQHAKDAGADVTINYREEDVPARVMEATDDKGVDHYIEVDLHGNAKMLPHVCAFGGYIVVYGSNKADATLIAPEFYFRHLKMEGFALYFLGKERFAEVGRAINSMLEKGQLKHRVAASYPLDDIALAHEDVEFGKVLGNVVVVP